MKLQYTYSFAEYQAINRARRHNVRFFRLRILLFWGLVISNFAVSAWYIYRHMQGLTGFNWWMFANLAVGLLILAYRFIISPWRGRRYFAQQMLDQREISLEVNENGIETFSANISGQYSWPGIVGAHEEPEHFIIWVNMVLGLSVPKRAFADQAQMDEFRNILAKNIDTFQLSA